MQGIHGRESQDQNSANTNFIETMDEYVFSVDVPGDRASAYIAASESEIGEQIQAMQAFAVKKNQKEKFDGVQVPPKTGRPQQQPTSQQRPSTQQNQASSSSTDKPVPNILARPVPPHMATGQKQSSASSAPQDKGKQVDRSGGQQNARGPMRPVEYQPRPAAEDAKFHYQSAIEKTFKPKSLVDRALDGHITISTRELLAASPEVRKQVKDLVIGKRVAVNNVAADVEGEIDDYGLAQCFETEAAVRDPKDAPADANISYFAKDKLDLRVIYPTFAPGLEPECILDSGSQIIVMHKDVWEKTGAPLSTNLALRMDSANGTTSMTLGMIENHPVKIGPVTFYLQIHVVRDAPFEVLLGRPFFDVAGANEISRPGGQHVIEIQDPESKKHYLFTTEPKLKRGEHLGVLPGNFRQ
jgi:hypothetical protein